MMNVTYTSFVCVISLSNNSDKMMIIFSNFRFLGRCVDRLQFMCILLEINIPYIQIEMRYYHDYYFHDYFCSYFPDKINCLNNWTIFILLLVKMMEQMGVCFV